MGDSADHSLVIDKGHVTRFHPARGGVFELLGADMHINLYSWADGPESALWHQKQSEYVLTKQV